MERLFETNPGLAKLRGERFVTVKVYASPVTYNLKGLNAMELQALKAAAPSSLMPSEVLSRYPQITGYPYLLILDGNGNLLKGKDIEEFEVGYSYNPARLGAFLDAASSPAVLTASATQ